VGLTSRSGFHLVGSLLERAVDTQRARSVSSMDRSQ